MSFPQYRYLAPEQLEATPHDFEKAARLLRTRTGIVLGDHKREMAARALSTRARKLSVASIAEYLTFLEHHPKDDEWHEFINAFTINHTAFFREQHHFKMLAEFVRTRKAPVSVWTCAASTGEEAYSIAITLRETLGPTAAATVWATDIDTQAISRAQRGIYTGERVEPVPEHLLHKYFLRGKGGKSGMVRVKPSLSEMVRFEPLNLLDPVWPTDQKFDAIFCRNTMIYFDKTTQTRILTRFAPMLKDGGLLFAGHSENFTYLTDAFRLRGQTVYTVVR